VELIYSSSGGDYCSANGVRAGCHLGFWAELIYSISAGLSADGVWAGCHLGFDDILGGVELI
jgi:hypothetical protein